jgi:hypothetical protein
MLGGAVSATTRKITGCVGIASAPRCRLAYFAIRGGAAACQPAPGFGGQASQAVAATGTPHRSICTGVPWCMRCAASPRT